MFQHIRLVLRALYFNPPYEMKRCNLHVISVVAYDGESALELVKNDDPEVMIIDLKMPGINGMDVLLKVKQTGPKLKSPCSQVTDRSRTKKSVWEWVHLHTCRNLLISTC